MSCTFISHAKEVLQGAAKAKAAAMEVIGGKAESYAKKACPVDTGNLRNSITHAQVDENTEVIGSNVSYAAFVELGTSKMKARPYLRPAAENHGPEYKFIYEQFMKHG